MGCDDDVVKCLVFWANFFLALVGIVILSLGIIYKINFEELTYVIPKNYHNIILISVLTIPLGSIIIFLAVFGCYGCITERYYVLTIYGIILLVIFSGQLAAGVYAFIQSNDKYFDIELNTTINEVFGNYADVYDYKEVTDLVQHRLKCCGVNGSTYWKFAPKSCYQTDTKIIFEVSCPALVSKYLHECLRIIGTTLLAFSTTELIGSIISLLFATYLKRDHRRLQDAAFSVYDSPSVKEYPFIY